MSKVIQRSLSLVLALAMVVTGLVVSGKTVDAKAKSYTAYLMYADKNWKVQANMSDKYVGSKKVKNKKGSQNVTLTLKRSQLDNSSEKITDTAVFCVDIVDLMKDYKESKVKISNVVVKVDGKKVAIKAAKLKQGYIEKEHQSEGNYKYRLEIYNDYGDTVSAPCAASSKFAFSKSISVSFKITLK